MGTRESAIAGPHGERGRDAELVREMEEERDRQDRGGE